MWTLATALHSPPACFTGDSGQGETAWSLRTEPLGVQPLLSHPWGASSSLFYPEVTAWGDADERAL